jgi:DNA-binding CsgD family transcriptional regulator
MLQGLGLSGSAEAVYKALLAEPRLSISSLGEQLGLSEREVRAALDELVRLTLLRESRDEPGQVRTVPPEAGLERLLRQQEEQVARRQHELAVAKARVADAVAEFARLQPNAPDGNTVRLAGLDEITRHLEVLARALTTECLSVMPGGGQSRASLEASKGLDEEAMQSGISLRTLYQHSVRNDADTLSYARWLTERGGQVRIAPLLPPRMLIFDRKIAVVPVDPLNSRLGALSTREPGFILMLVAVFELAWNTAVPLGTTTDAEGATGLAPIDRELLRLLATGLTDEAAGKRLGISARTVRRRMSALMERLDATSRFEAGLKAAHRGWFS